MEKWRSEGRRGRGRGDRGKRVNKGKWREERGGMGKGKGEE